MRKNYLINYLTTRPMSLGALPLFAAFLAAVQANPVMANETHFFPVGEQVLASQSVFSETAGWTDIYAGDSTIILSSTDTEKLAVRLPAADSSVGKHEIITTAQTELKAVNNNPYALAINHDGLTRANGALIVNGRVFLTAKPGIVRVTSDSAIIAAGTTEFTNTVNHDGKDILLPEGHSYADR